MSYYAKGGGDCSLKENTTMEQIDSIKLLSGLEIESYDVRSGRFFQNNSSFGLAFEYNKYDQDDFEKDLEKLSPYIVNGSIDMIGEDDAAWRYAFEDDEWHYYTGNTKFDNDVPEAKELRLQMENYQKVNKIPAGYKRAYKKIMHLLSK